MKKFKDTVISTKQFDKVCNLLDGTDFQGVDYEKFISLFKYGFVYDSLTEKLITTHTVSVWNDLNVPIKFSITNLPLDKINKVFDEHSTEILSENKLVLSEWNELCDSYKINLIEISTGGLELKELPLDIDCHGLIQYLTNLVNIL